MRGEYGFVVRKGRKHVELPPRARRIHLKRGHILAFLGTTSACAENTQWLEKQYPSCWNYLRVRGEYSAGTKEYDSNMELPPRARRIRQLFTRGHKGHGTTSACAENTGAAASSIPNPRNYLRVRGEYLDRPRREATVMELPPRARRILGRTRQAYRQVGTTSACAENTSTCDTPH